VGSHMSRPSHSIPANGRAIAIRHPCVDTRLNVDASGVGPGAGSMFRRPPSLRRAGVLLNAATQTPLVNPWRWQDLPSSRETPLPPRTCSFDPGRIKRNSPSRSIQLGCGSGNDRNFFDGLSRLNHMAQRLAVYASQQRVAPLPRKTRLRLSARLCRAGFAPAGFHREVSAMFSASHRFLLSRVSLAQSLFRQF
jgi:hypothetical protein